MPSGTGVLLLAIAFVVAVVVVAVALCRPSTEPPSTVARAAALFIIATIYNGLWFGLVHLLQALFGPF